jgi:hypothetical protein
VNALNLAGDTPARNATAGAYDLPVNCWTNEVKNLMHIGDEDPANDLASLLVDATLGFTPDGEGMIASAPFDITLIASRFESSLGSPSSVPNANDKFLRYDIAQTLSDPQKAQARANIGAGTGDGGGTGVVPSGIAYLSVNGSDETGDGSPQKPFATIQHAYNQEFARYHFLDAYNAGLLETNFNLECWVSGVKGGYFGYASNSSFAQLIAHGSGLSSAGIGTINAYSGGLVRLIDMAVSGGLNAFHNINAGNGAAVELIRSRVQGSLNLAGRVGPDGVVGSPAVITLNFSGSGGDTDTFELNGASGTVSYSGTIDWSDVTGWSKEPSGATCVYTSLSSTATATVDEITNGFVTVVSAVPGADDVAGENGGNGGQLRLIHSEIVGSIDVARGLGGAGTPSGSNGANGEIFAYGSTFTPPGSGFTIAGNYNSFQGCWINDGSDNFRFYTAWD